MRKEIRIVHADHNKPELNRLVTDKIYRSWSAVAKAIPEGEEVVVSVHEGTTNMMILAGYGYVKNEGDSYSYPRRLMHDY